MHAAAPERPPVDVTLVANTPWDSVYAPPPGAPTRAASSADRPVAGSFASSVFSADEITSSTAGFADAAPAAERPASPRGSWGSAFSLPTLCLGLAVIACCMLIPAADENRRLTYEKSKLQADLAQLDNQANVNDEFLKRVADDPTLAERLARRQMKMVPQGSAVLELRTKPSADRSPFLLTTVPPPPAVAEYQPVGGRLSALCLNWQTRLYLIGAGLLLSATGLVIGAAPRTSERAA